LPRSEPHRATISSRNSHHLSRDDNLANLASAIILPLITIVIMRGPGSLPPAPTNEPVDRSSTNRPGTPLLQRPSLTSGPGVNVHRDRDVLPLPHPIPPREHRSECDRRIEELRHSYEQLLGEKDVRIGELRKEKDGRIEEIKKERDARIEEIKEEKDERIEEVKREKDERIEDLKEEKDARIEEVKRDRDVAIKSMEDQLERSHREVLQLREENNRLKDEIMRLKVRLGRPDGV
jgi:hypothetical protein